MSGDLRIPNTVPPVARLPLIPVEPAKLTSTAPAPVDRYQPAIRPGRRVLVIGDSHTAGLFGSDLDHLLRETKATVATYGSCGTSPASWLKGTPTQCGFFARHDDGHEDPPTKRIKLPNGKMGYEPHPTPKIQQLLQEEHPDVVIVALGANLLSGSETNKASARKLLDAITVTGAQCIWVGPPNGRPSVVDPAVRDEVNAALKDVVAGRCVYVDSRPLTPSYPDGEGDGRHYTGPKGKLIARGWAAGVADVATALPQQPAR